MSIKYECSLLEIKQKLGGSVKLIAGYKAVIYRLYPKVGKINLIIRVKGYIRNSVILKQL